MRLGHLYPSWLLSIFLSVWPLSSAFGICPEFIPRFEALLSPESTIKQAALDTIKYIERSGFTKVPKTSKAGDLYQQFLLYRDHPKFQEELKKRPQVWAVFERHMTERSDVEREIFEYARASSIKQAALNTIKYIEKSGFTAVPKSSKDRALDEQFLRYCDNPEFQEELKKHPQAWAVFEREMTEREIAKRTKAKRTKLRPVIQAALDTAEYIEKSGFTEIPMASKNRPTYERFLRYREDPEFQEELKKHPRAWAVFERALASDSRRAALDTIEYIEKSDFTEIPRASKNRATYERFLQFRDDPEFQEELKKKPQAWIVFETKYLKLNKLAPKNGYTK